MLEPMNTNDIENKRKQVYYISNHRGTKENDLIFNRFCARYLETLTDQELDDFLYILQYPDQDILDWILGKVEAPKALDSDFSRKFFEFCMMGLEKVGCSQ